MLIGWARNHFDIWARKKYLKKYDTIFCSSQKAVGYFKNLVEVPVYLLPLASNLDKYTFKNNANRSKVIFIGNRWTEPRAFEKLRLEDIDFEFEIYGNGWDDSPFSKFSKGPISNDLVATKYQEAAIVLDAANDTTREWESVNSRIFNSIACGALPISDAEATNKLLINNIPVYNSPAELLNLIKTYLDNPTQRQNKVNGCYKELTANHSYDHRATQLQLALSKKLNISIKIAAPDQKEAASWGDNYFAQGLQKYFERLGHLARIDTIDTWYGEDSLEDDLHIVLHGLGNYQPIAGVKSFLWVISHPEDFNIELFGDYDHVFFASSDHYSSYKEKFVDKASCLLQCTDHELFYPREVEDKHVNENLYIGNSRDVFRDGVKYSITAQIPISIIGGGWDKYVNPKSLKSIFAPYNSLPHYYSGCRLLINDHWEDMRTFGYISNRIFDAGACGANIISDKPKDIESIFGNHINYYNDAPSFQEAVSKVSSSKPSQDLELSTLIRSQHTFEQRVNKILQSYYSI